MLTAQTYSQAQTSQCDFQRCESHRCKGCLPPGFCPRDGEVPWEPKTPPRAPGGAGAASGPGVGQGRGQHWPEAALECRHSPPGRAQGLRPAAWCRPGRGRTPKASRRAACSRGTTRRSRPRKRTCPLVRRRSTSCSLPRLQGRRTTVPWLPGPFPLGAPATSVPYRPKERVVTVRGHPAPSQVSPSQSLPGGGKVRPSALKGLVPETDQVTRRTAHKTPGTHCPSGRAAGPPPP